MNKVLCSLLAGLTMAVATPAANAADLGARYAPPAPVPVYTAPVAEGWYLRGDVGGSAFRNKGDWHETEIDTPVASDDLFNDWTKTKWGSSGILSVGAGYQFNDYLRGDLTAEYRSKSKINGKQAIVDVNHNYLTGDDSSKIDSWVFLANLYTDIGHYHGITPYVGFGVGAALNRFSEGRQESVITFANGDPTTYSGGTYAKGSKWNLAGALHAGLSYDITSQLALDASYRWLWLGDAKSGVKTCDGTCSQANEKWWINDMMSHDIRLGLRYKFFDDTPARVPVIAKN